MKNGWKTLFDFELWGHHALAGHVTTSVGRAAGGVAEAARQATRKERRQRAKEKAKKLFIKKKEN